MAGSGLRLELNIVSTSGSSLSPIVMEINQSGLFQFPNLFPKDYRFIVNIISQSNNPSQNCSLFPTEGFISSISHQILLISCDSSNSSLEIPVYSPPPGEYSSSISLQLSSSNANVQIFYTTDGTDPICGVSNLYNSPINLAVELSQVLPVFLELPINCNAQLARVKLVPGKQHSMDGQQKSGNLEQFQNFPVSWELLQVAIKA